jgi:hypothetical protein
MSVAMATGQQLEKNHRGRRNTSTSWLGRLHAQVAKAYGNDPAWATMQGHINSQAMLNFYNFDF